jgi:putative sigma-54 modulation protein
MKQKTFDVDGYSVAITGKNIQVTEAIENYVMEKLSKLERFANHILDVTVVLDIQKVTHTASISMKFLHFRINVTANTEDTYSAIDKAADKLYVLIQKYKKKLQNHRHSHLADVDLNVNVFKPRHVDDLAEINDEIEKVNLEEEKKKYKFHDVVAKEQLPLKILRQDEAIMKMELSGDIFMLYKGEEDQKIKVIYRRDDDNYGIIEVQ